MKEQSKEKWAYLAGLLDGEGCFTIAGSWKRRTPKTPRGSDTYFHMNLIISLYNNNLKVMKWLIEHFGGVYYVHHPSQKSTHKVGYSWHPKGAKNKETMILNVLPYMIIKHEQAVLSLEYIRFNGARAIERRLEIRERISTLNGHGEGKRPTTNMSDRPESVRKIESDLTGDRECEPAVTQVVPLELLADAQTQMDEAKALGLAPR